MATVTLMLNRPHAGQADVLRSASRFNALACGRRWGKSTLGENLVIEPALEGYPTAWFSPTYKMLLEIWRDLAQIVAPITRRVSAQEHRLELVTGGVIEMWSLDQPGAGRSRKYRRVIIDEAALTPALGEAWQAAIRPTLADLQGDAWALSTPRGRTFFAQMYDWGQDPAHEEWASWQRPTHDNPHIPPAEIAAMAAELPERIYSQEILAQFLDDAGGVFRRVREAATLQPAAGPVPGHQHIIGADWGKQHDSTVFSVIDATAGEQVALDRSNRVDYTVQRGRLAALAERWQPTAIVAERNSIGEPIIEELQRAGLPVQPFTTTNATKAAIIDGLALAFERGTLRLLDDPVQTAELLAFEATRLPSGLLRYAAPEGMHDDTVMALALAWHGANHTSAGVYL